MQAHRLAALAALLAAPALCATADAQTPAAARSVAGTWGGALEPGPVRLRLKLIIPGTEGGSSATLVSVDQGGVSIPATFSVRGDSVIFDVSRIGGAYRAVLSAGADSLTGTWAQGGGELPLVMVRGADSMMVVRRPQEPQRPFPYREEEVAYESVDGVRLAGTLTLPPGDGPHPAVLLITGSGSQDRDETVFNHRPFLVLSDYLTRRGIAVLRVDDRGVGSSTGNPATATSADFAQDVAAGVRFLRGRREIGPIGLIGHSEGGLIAPMAAALAPEVRFLVLLAGPGTDSRTLLGRQTELIMAAGGVPDSVIRRIRPLQRELLEAAASDADSAALHEQLSAIAARYRTTLSRAEQELVGIHEDGAFNQLLLPWMRWFLAYDPQPALRRVTVPVLALNGALDLQVPPDENLAGIEQALRAAGNRDVTVEKLPGLNHLFQTARTGAPTEYGEIEETFSPAALQRIGDWIVQRFPPP
ncbi:MAG TPA: alpha/beta fold hydrolase [Longimicrobium sp.]|nr:alpha/beta fold hydrolase [Longimicrobium sp.]